MKSFQIITTNPNEANFNLFEELPQALYPANHFRFKLGHDPINTHLVSCHVLMDGNKPVGRYAFYENPKLQYQNQTTATIGSYECIDDFDAAQFLINDAIKLAKSKGYQWLIGPMEGSTWNNYRFSVHNDHSPFFMEPSHHLYYNNQFQQAGFKNIANYISNKTNVTNYDKEQLEEFEKKYLDKGARFRNLDLKNLSKDLEQIAQLSLDSFQNNFLFTPIEVDEFVQKYLKLEKLFDPKLVWIVEDPQKEIQAFVFAIKDFWDPSEKTIILKSLARKSTSSFRGIGTYLAHKINAMAFDLGYEYNIHAFMISDNTTVHMSKKFLSTPYKSYTLYGIQL